MTEPEIDTAIDRAVRDLMNVDAVPGFRARVVDRLQKPARRPLSLRLVSFVAAGAVFVLALVWMPSSPPAPTAPAPIARGVEAPASRMAPQVEVAGVVRQPVPQPAEARRARAAGVRDATHSIPPGVLTAADAPATSIAPLIAIEPITVEPMATTPIATSAIEVAPLPPIVEVEISSLEPRPARN
jgi:hypothetical protein